MQSSTSPSLASSGQRCSCSRLQLRSLRWTQCQQPARHAPVCRASAGVQERTQESSTAQRPRTEQQQDDTTITLADWDTLRRMRYVARGQNATVPFRRKIREPVPTPVIEPELFEPEVLPEEQQHDPQQEAADSPAASSEWLMVVGLSALLAMICSVDRAAMSVALGPMGQEFQWSDTQKGLISSSFFLGYTLTNFVGGYAATRFNAKTILAAGATVWSIFTIATPSMAGNLPALMATRAAMGMGEGVTFPAISNLFSQWVPKDKLSSSLSVAFSGGPVGIMAALLAAPLLISTLGWQSIFWLFGSAGLAWTAYWQSTVSDQPVLPEAKPSVSGSQNGSKEADVVELSDVPWGEFLRNRSLWALLWLHCSHNMGPLICLSWMPSYYAQEFGLDVGQSAMLSVLPWGLNVACTNAAGWLGDKAVHEWGVDKTLTRKLMQALASLGPAGCLFALACDQGLAGESHAMGMWFSVAMLTGTLALSGFQAAGLGSNHQDIAPRWAGILFGITNACGSIAGVAGIMGTGYLLDATHSWGQVFNLAAGVYFVGYLGFAAWGSAKQQFD